MPRSTKNWTRTMVRPARKCARGSFRSKKVDHGKVLLTFCCPKGAWRNERCIKGMKLAEKATRR